VFGCHVKYEEHYAATLPQSQKERCELSVRTM
jgi:hypothetical protein